MDKATATQLANIEKRTGRTLDELARAIKASTLTRHGELREMLKREYGMGHGDANTLVHHVLKSDGTSASGDKPIGAVIDELYSGPKASLRPIHDAVMTAIAGFGAFDIVPKKGYLSLRRKKQFAMIGPATRTAVEIGVNARDLLADPRLIVVPAGGMCQYKVRLSAPEDLDARVIGWIRRAYDAAA